MRLWDVVWVVFKGSGIHWGSSSDGDFIFFQRKGGGEVDDAQRMRPEYTILHPHPIYHQ